MNRFCTACGAPLEAEALFCGACGEPVKRSAESAPASDTSEAVQQPVSDPSTVPLSPPISSPELERHWATEDPPETVFAPPTSPAAPAFPPEPDPAYFEEKPEGTGMRKYLIGGGVLFLLLVAGLYYWLFLADDFGRGQGGRRTAAVEKTDDTQKPRANLYYAATSANIRNIAASEGSEIIGKLARGDEVQGKLITAEDGSEWLELPDGKGFIFAANLATAEMPFLATKLDGKSITLAADADLWSAPGEGAELLDRLSKGLTINVSGITGNDYVEVVLRKGGVGYIANGAKVVKDGDGPKGPAIAIVIDSLKCPSGPEIDALFKKLDAQYQAGLKAVENATYPDDAARDAAIEKFSLENEGESRFMKVQRSFKGLQMTGIGGHYEGLSVYFAEPPEKVIEVFRGLGQKVDKDGQLHSEEISSGIGAATGKGASMGKSEWNCGV